MAQAAGAVAGNGHDIMARIAAKLMGGKATTASVSASVNVNDSAKATPRTVPSAQALTSTTPVTAPRSIPKPEHPPTAPKEIATPQPPNIQQQPLPTAEKLDIDMLDANDGPSLRGNPEQLALARGFRSEFKQNAPPTRVRSRPNRERLTSVGTTGGQLSGRSSSRSSRTSVASVAASRGYPPPSATPSSRPVTRTQTSSLGGSPSSPRSRVEPATTGMSALHNRPAVNTNWNAYAAKPSTNTTATNVDSLNKSFDQVKISHAHPVPSSTTPKKDEAATPRPGWPWIDVTNTLKDRANDMVPPHKRAKAAAAGTVANPIVVDETQTTKPPAKINHAVTSETDSLSKTSVNPLSPPTVAKATEVKPIEVAKQEAATAHSTPPVNGATSGTMAAEAAKQEVATSRSTPVINGAASGTTAQTTTSTKPTSNDRNQSNDAVLNIVQALRDELKTISGRVVSLEQENFTLQKQMEIILQVEERRKFLGTDQAIKVPFTLEVKCPSGAIENVQVSAELKISDLIRRVRVKASLLPGATPNPRVAVNGVQIGHGITLHEAGISKEKQGTVDVVFSFDAPK